MDTARYSKAIAGAFAALIVAAAAHYNVQFSAEVNTALNVLLDAVVALIIGYVVVYVSPPNKQ